MDKKSGRLHLDPGNMERLTTIPWFRCAVGGLLMGLANLVPGVSGGTMILIMGLYDEFVSAIADLCRLKFRLRSVLLLGVIAGVAVVAVASLAGALGRLVVSEPVAMYSLFIGLTLGGAPLLWRMVKPWNAQARVACSVGIVAMIAIALLSPEPERLTSEEKADIKARVARGKFPLTENYPRDIAAGILGMSAMVMPGISGAYMLLLLGRYEQILAAIAAMRDYVLSSGNHADPASLHILFPVALGAAVSLIGVSNLLKWLLHRHERPTVALLLGVLIGSVFTLFRMVDVQSGGDVAVASVLLATGCIVTTLFGRIGGRRQRRTGQCPSRS